MKGDMRMVASLNDSTRNLTCAFCKAEFSLKSSQMPLVKVVPMDDPSTALWFGKYAKCPECERGNVVGV